MLTNEIINILINLLIFHIFTPFEIHNRSSGKSREGICPNFVKLYILIQKIIFHYLVNNLKQRFNLSLSDLEVKLLNRFPTYDSHCQTVNNILIYLYLQLINLYIARKIGIQNLKRK